MAFRGASRAFTLRLLNRNLRHSVGSRCRALQESPFARLQEAECRLHTLAKSRAFLPSSGAYKPRAQADFFSHATSSSTSRCTERSDKIRDNPSTNGHRDAVLETQDCAAQLKDEAPVTQPSPVNVVVDSSFKASPRHDLAMLFTCNVCGVRSAKTMSRATYETGVVIVRCPGCQNLHLIADRYGWFGEAGSVEDFLAEKGVNVKKGSEESYQFTMEDLSGWTERKL